LVLGGSKGIQRETLKVSVGVSEFLASEGGPRVECWGGFITGGETQRCKKENCLDDEGLNPQLSRIKPKSGLDSNATGEILKERNVTSQAEIGQGGREMTTLARRGKKTKKLVTTCKQLSPNERETLYNTWTGIDPSVLTGVAGVTAGGR